MEKFTIMLQMKSLMKENIREWGEIPLFSDIKADEIPSLLECLRAFVRTYEKDEFIVMYNDSVEWVGVLLEGTVHMIKEDLQGNKSILAVIKERELFGETFACGVNTTSTVAFVAITPVKILFVHFDKVMHSCTDSCEAHYKLVKNMVTLIALKNAQLMDKLEITSKRTLREKVCTFLAMYAQRNNSTHFTIPMGRLELADYLCVDRSALTRELNNMKKQGIIDFEKNTFKILF